MSLSLHVPPRARYFDSNGNPLSSGRVTFYSQGTETLKSIYADPNGAVELSNPLELDADGYVPESGVFYAEGNYSIRLEGAEDPGNPLTAYYLIYDILNVPGTPAAPTAEATAFIASVEDLADVDTTAYAYAWCPSYYAGSTDNGGGWFRWWPASTATENLGTIFASTATPAVGRWIRVIQDGFETHLAWWGPKTGINSSTRMVNANSYAIGTDTTLVMDTGTVEWAGTVTISAPCRIEASFQFAQYDGTSTILALTGTIEVAPRSTTIPYAVASDLYMTAQPPVETEVDPLWFGAETADASTHYYAFYNMGTARSARVTPVISRAYSISAPGPVPSALAFDRVRFVEGGSYTTAVASHFEEPILPMAGGKYVIPSALDIVTTSRTKLQARFMLDNAPTATELFRFWQTATKDYTLGAQVIWDGYDYFTLTQTGAGVNPLDTTPVRVQNIFQGGTYWTLSDEGSYGEIAGSDDCLSTGGEVPVNPGKSILPAWWGASDLTSTAINNAAWAKAIACSTASSGLVIDGQGLSYDLAAMTWTTGSYLNIKNADLTETGAISWTNAAAVSLDGVQITAGGAVAIDTTGPLDVDGCEFTVGTANSVSLGSVTYQPTTVRVKNSTVVTGGLSVFCGSVGSQITGNAVRNCQALVAGSTAAITFSEPSNSQITGNTFTISLDSTALGDWAAGTGPKPVALYGNAGGTYVVSGLRMTGNAIMLAAPAAAYTGTGQLLWATGMATDGHTADVFDNSTNIVEDVTTSTGSGQPTDNRWNLSGTRLQAFYQGNGVTTSPSQVEMALILPFDSSLYARHFIGGYATSENLWWDLQAPITSPANGWVYSRIYPQWMAGGAIPATEYCSCEVWSSTTLPRQNSTSL